MIEKLLQKSIDKGENWLERDANNLDALHYIGISYTYLGRLEAHRGNLYSGGMKGETGRKYFERAIEICGDMPCASGIEDTNECETCEEIYFPHGAYSYFAGRLPGLLKLFSFLWFIPHGSTKEGLSELERAAKNARLHNLGSKILLANIYALFEKGHLDRSLSISSELVKRYPNNSYLDLGHAKFLVLAGHYDEAIERSESIIQKATENKISYENIAKLGAQLVIAEAAIRKNKLNQAEKLLLELSGDPASQNNTLTSQIPLLQGMLADLKGKREQAVQFYQETKAHEGRTRNRTTSKEADKYLDQPFTP
jgi:tetratricopeptide (TPR) repeat protein